MYFLSFNVFMREQYFLRLRLIRKFTLYIAVIFPLGLIDSCVNEISNILKAKFKILVGFKFGCAFVNAFDF